MAAASGQDNAQSLFQEQMDARLALQVESLKQKVEQFLPRFAAKFNEDTQGIQNLKQTPCVELVSTEWETFWVPRRIILARCPGLKRLLEEKGENFCGPVEMTKLGSKTLKVLIQYLEEGTLHPEWRSLEVIPELCEAAKEYELSLLFQFLDESLVNLCDSGRTAVTLMRLANGLGMKEAKEQISNWMDSPGVYRDMARTAAQRSRSLWATRLEHRELELRVETLEGTLGQLRMETED